VMICTHIYRQTDIYQVNLYKHLSIGRKKKGKSNKNKQTIKQ
jgi:hypothetical protein